MHRGSRGDRAPAPTPLRGKRARTRQQLIDAALRVLARAGTRPISIQEVTAEAGVANGTFYNYFRTREEILEASAGPLTQRLVRRIGATNAALDDPAQRLSNGVRNFVEQALADPVWAAALLRVFYSTTTLPRRTATRLLADLRDGHRRGRFRYRDEAAALDLVQGAVIACIRSVTEGTATPSRGSEIVALLLRALGMRPAEADALAKREMPPLPAAD